MARQLGTPSRSVRRCRVGGPQDQIRTLRRHSKAFTLARNGRGCAVPSGQARTHPTVSFFWGDVPRRPTQFLPPPEGLWSCARDGPTGGPLPNPPPSSTSRRGVRTRHVGGCAAAGAGPGWANPCAVAPPRSCVAGTPPPMGPRRGGPARAKSPPPVPRHASLSPPPPPGRCECGCGHTAAAVAAARPALDTHTRTPTTVLDGGRCLAFCVLAPAG